MKLRVIRSFYILMGAVFLPVLFCVIFVGNRMDYNPFMKTETLLPNYVLFALALSAVGLTGFLFCKTDKIELTSKRNAMVNGGLVFLFSLLYFLNVWVLKEIGFKLPWDIEIVRGVAYSIAEQQDVGYFYNLSVYSNNIPIAYILGRLYRIAMNMGNYPYVYDFIWLQVNCVLVSAGGYFCCLTVKKLTKRIMPTAAAFLLYLGLVGISPWKMAPYTDVYGLIFPIMCIYFYLSYRSAEKPGRKYLFIILSLFSGMTGGLIKPSIYLTVIAVLGVELICFMGEYREKWKYLAAEIALTIILAFAKEACVNYMIDDMGMIFNEEIEAGWQHYLLMGANEDSTGSYDSDDAGIFGEFQTSKKERNKAALERAARRMGEKGIIGNLGFWLRKMVMVFNDGTFGWGCEIWISDYYPAELSSNNAATQLLRDIFWPNMVFTGRYNTFCQLMWIFCMTGIPGLCLCGKEMQKECAVLAVSFLGIFFYQMLFEAQARYLYVFSPFLIALSLYGMDRYVCRIRGLMQKRKQAAGAGSGYRSTEDIRRKETDG